MSPLFDFQCPACENVEEYLVFKDSEIFVCPICRTEMNRLLVGITHVRFALREGVWEKDPTTGQEVYKGKGGRQVPFSSKLPKHTDMDLNLSKDKFYKEVE